MYAKLKHLVSLIWKKASTLFPVFDIPVSRIIVFFLLFAFIFLKSYVNLNENWRTFGSFLLLGLGFALIFRSRDKWSEWAGFVLISLLIFSPFYLQLQGLDNDGFTITGVLPQSDAIGYYTGAVNVLYGGQISSVASRRPLFVVFLSGLLSLFKQNLIASLLGMALIVSLAILLLAIEVRKNFGAIPSALIAIMMIYCYTGRFAGKFSTEQLGIPLGMLSFALLLRGLRKKDFGSVSFGVFILTLALNARAGAFFVLPLLILWGALWQEEIRFSFKHFGVLTICVLLGFLVNFLVFKSLSVPGAIPFSNFGPTLYGMVTGYRGWQSFYGDHPGAPEQVAFSLSMKIFLNSPSTFLVSVLKAYQDFINPLRFFSFLYLPDEQMVPTAYLLTILTLVGLWKLVKYRNTLFARMILLVFSGIILSVPFVPPIDDGIRAMTATTSFLAILVGLPFVGHEQLGFDGVESIRARTKFNGLNFISSVVILLIVIGWVGLKINPKVASPELSCNPGETPIIIPISGGSYINVIAKKESALSLIPNIRPDDLQKNLAHYAPISLRVVFQKLQVGQTMMLGLNLADHQSSQLIWLIVPTDLVQNFNGINTFCAVPTRQKELDQELYIERTVKNIFIMP